MRIALDATAAAHAHLSGAGTYVSSLARALALELGPDGQLLLCTRLSHWRDRGQRLTGSGDRVVQRWFEGRFGPRGRPDVFHALDDFVPHRSPGRLVVSVHDARSMLADRFAPSSFRIHNRSRYADIALRAARVIFSSDYVRREYLEGFPEVEGRDAVVHPGVSEHFQPMGPEAVAAARQRHGLPADYALYVGEISARKNLVTQARALAQAAPGLPWVWLGEDGIGAAEARSAIAGLDGVEVIDVGYVDPGELPALYSGARLLTLVTRDEGYALAALEAMACGTPVVVATREAVCEMTGGFAIEAEPGSAEAVAEAIRRVVDDAAQCRELADRGLAHARTFTWQRAARDTLAVYRAALER